VQFKNVSGVDLDIPALGITVAKGEEFEATGDVAQGLLDQSAFTRTDKPSSGKKES
jgi:hypothetical protein